MRLKLRFGLRSLLIFVTLAAALLGWLGLRIREGQRQKEVYLELFRRGHSADWSHYELVALPGRTPNAELRSTLPVWLERTPLAAAVHRIDKVTIRGDGPAAYNKAIRLLAELGHVRTVSVYGQAFSEADLERLLAAVQIKQLYLERAQLPRGHIPSLASQNLTWLCVAQTQFSDPAIADLPASLIYFDATRTRISDRGLAGFVRLTHLKSLDLSRTPTSQAAIEVLRRDMSWCEVHWEPLVQQPPGPDG